MNKKSTFGSDEYIKVSFTFEIDNDINDDIDKKKLIKANKEIGKLYRTIRKDLVKFKKVCYKNNIRIKNLDDETNN